MKMEKNPIQSNSVQVNTYKAVNTQRAVASDRDRGARGSCLMLLLPLASCFIQNLINFYYKMGKKYLLYFINVLLILYSSLPYF